MNGHSHFAYAQARLQARHGRRATPLDWRRLAGAGNLDNFLQAARRTPLRPWTQGLQSGHSSHDIELQLRMQFRNYVDEVAPWMPVPWQASLSWIRYLPDLPALQYLLTSKTTPGWMLADPVLREIVQASGNSRLEALINSEFSPLASAWQQDFTLPDAWLQQWQRRWPKDKEKHQGLMYLSNLLKRFIKGQRAADGMIPAGNAHHSLASGLQYAFRRYSFQPACAAAHLGLIALDLQRLRGELVYRALFDGNTAVHA